MNIVYVKDYAVTVVSLPPLIEGVDYWHILINRVERCTGGALVNIRNSIVKQIERANEDLVINPHYICCVVL